MTERTLTGKKRPPAKSAWGAPRSRRRAAAEGARRRGDRAGVGSLAALPWALGLLGASAVLAAAAVFAR
jgi:hypothetical protein